MSGSNSICVATVLLDTGIITMKEPITEMVLEASGGITQASIAAIAATGVDYISCGDLTKSVEPLDLSMRFLLDE